MDGNIQNRLSTSSTTIPPAFGKKNFGLQIAEISMWNHTHPNRLSKDHILAPKGCCTPKFLHAIENDQVSLAHLQWGQESPLPIFFKGGSKIGLNFSEIATIILKPKRIA